MMENTDKFKVKGRILEIIPPKKHQDYMLPMHPHNKESPFYGCYYLLITETDIPLDIFKSFFKRNIWKLKDKKNKGKMTYTIVMKDCPYEVGQEVELEIKRYCEPTEIYIGGNLI